MKTYYLILQYDHRIYIFFFFNNFECNQERDCNDNILVCCEQRYNKVITNKY